MRYSHAKDYLIELASNSSTQGWLKELLIRVINSNGNLRDADIMIIMKMLIQGKSCTSSLPNSLSNYNSIKIELVELTHHSGVSALVPEQTIHFSDSITLLYGSNGSGKSSYYRIINEIAGGNQEEIIEPNIYVDHVDPINVDIKYKENDQIKNYHWDGNDRGVFPLNLCTVFDSHYTDSFLGRHSADEVVVYPYGLYLFTATTRGIDDIRSKITSLIERLTSNLPLIASNDLLHDVKAMIEQKSFSHNIKSYVEERYDFLVDKQTKLKELEKGLSDIKATNYNDKISLEKSNLAQIKSLLSFLRETKNTLGTMINDIQQLISQIIEARVENTEAKTKISILNEIGETDMKEWKSFIEAGKSYVDKSKLVGVCPYCRQQLSKQAGEIISAYKAYLEDKTETNLTTFLKEKKLIKSKVQELNVNFDITEQLSKILGTFDSKLLSKVWSCIKNFSSIKNELLSYIENESNLNIIIDTSIEDVIKFIGNIYSQVSKQVDKLEIDKKQKDSQIENLNNEIAPLMENKFISENKNQFTNWFDRVGRIKLLQQCFHQLSTRSVSTLAKLAVKELVTDNLKQKFQDELRFLGLNRLRVDLSDDGVNRGQTYMHLYLKNNKDVKTILSEGEQKGVALSLFLAERQMQQTKNPIILDDPVNSLDHLITAHLMERLSQLDNQVIIFSHHILLLNSLIGLNAVHLCGINQRSSCNKQSKHLYIYKVMSLGKTSKGVISEWKQDNVLNNLKKAKNSLNVNPFTTAEIDVVTVCLRKSIEQMIDEKVFRGLSPLRFNGKKTNINWEELKKLHADGDMIDELKLLYSRLSGGDLHSGVEHEENPLEHDELEEIYEKLNDLSLKMK